MANRRAANGTRQQTGSIGDSPFINLPWGKAQDEAFEQWIAANPDDDECSMLNSLMEAGLGVKLGQMNDSCYVTIDSPAAREKGLKPLLSGWSDTWRDALAVAYFKWDQLLGRDFAHPTPEAIKSRRR